MLGYQCVIISEGVEGIFAQGVCLFVCFFNSLFSYFLSAFRFRFSQPLFS